MNSINSDASCNSGDRLPYGGAARVKARPSGEKDKYYTDPVSRCKFHPMKDALRYIATGEEIGKLAIRPKDKDSNILGSKDDEACLPAATEVNSSNQSSKLSIVANDKQVLSPAGTGQSAPIYMHTSGEEGSQSKNSGVLENESSKQKVKVNDPNKSEIATTSAALLNENTLESEAMKDESKRPSSLGKSKEKKKNISLPRGTSKRLSGVPLHPTPELKTTNRARPAAAKQSDNKATCKSASETSKSTKLSLESCNNMDTEKTESENILASRDQVEKESHIKLGNATVTEGATKIQTNSKSQFLPEGMSITRPPLFTGEHYMFWKNRMKIFIQAHSMLAWIAIKDGPYIPTYEVEGITTRKPSNQWDDNDYNLLRENANAIHMLYCALSVAQFNMISGCETAQEIWKKLEVTYEGANKVREAKIDLLQQKLENFKMEPNESISSMDTRYTSLVNEMKLLGKKITEEEMVKKVLRSLTKEWYNKKTIIEEVHDLKFYGYDELIGNLLTHELSLERYSQQEKKPGEKKKGHIKAQIHP